METNIVVIIFVVGIDKIADIELSEILLKERSQCLIVLFTNGPLGFAPVEFPIW